MANVSLNLATRSLADRIDIAADLEACRLIHNKKHKGKEWRAWVESELMKMPNQEQVRTALNLRLQVSK